MKQVVLLIIMVVVLVGVGIWEIIYFDNSRAYIKSDVDYIINLVENNNLDMAKEHFESLDNTFNNLYKSWGIFIDHNTLQQLESNIEVFKVYVEYNDIEKAKASAVTIYNLLENVADVHKVTIQNVI